MHFAFTGLNDGAYLMTQANLLYQTGKNNDALAIITEDINRLGKRPKSLQIFRIKFIKMNPQVE